MHSIKRLCMKYLYKIFLSFFVFSSTLEGVLAQTNLVPNPSFEIYSSCPSGAGEVYKSTGWDSYCESPDYLNSCASVSFPQMSVPSNMLGFQYALSGNAYCGLYTYATTGFYREIIGAQLITPLIIGQKYFVSFEIVLTEIYGGCATDKIGTKFSTVPFSFSNPVPINNSAQVYSSSIITDTTNWTKITGSFTSDSSYNYIMLGNFFDDSNTDTAQVEGMLNCFSYYFIENVCVSTDSIYAANWTSNNEIQVDNSLSVFPNPTTNGICYIKSQEKIESIEIYDLLGKKINAIILNNIDLYEVDFVDNTSGIFFFKITINQVQYTQKVLITK